MTPVTAALALVVLILAPLRGWIGVLRLPALLAPIAAAALLSVKPWRWSLPQRAAVVSNRPSRRALLTAGVVVMCIIGWIVLTRFMSGDINAADFTVYFDRPLWQTAHGRPLFVETADLTGFSDRSEFAVHAYYLLLVFAPLYRIAASPYWLLAASVVAVTLGSAHIYRIVLRVVGAPVVALAASAAFLLNANTARTLMYGFHPEVLYAWLVPAAVDMALEDKRWAFTAAVIACVLVKEDAFLVLVAVGVTLALVSQTARDRWWLFVAFPIGLGVLNLAVFYRLVLPRLGLSAPTYASFWSSFGVTPQQAVIGMAMHPMRMLNRTLSSGIWRILFPFAFLPIVGWRWTLGTLPIVFIYGASDNPQVRAFGIYYAIPLVPFLAIGAAVGGLNLARRLTRDEPDAQLAAAAIVAVFALAAYGDRAGYALRPWRPEVLRTPATVRALAIQDAVLVQSALYAHAGYDARVVLLTPETLRDHRYDRAAVLLAPGLDAYPLSRADVSRTIATATVVSASDGLVVVHR